jgi:cell division protein FtsB
MVWIGLILVLVFFGLKLREPLSEKYVLNNQRDRLQTQVFQLTQTVRAIHTEMAHATSDKAVEEWARVGGHMVKPGDNLVVMATPNKVIVQPTPTPKVTQLPPQNWEVWWALFFGR